MNLLAHFALANGHTGWLLGALLGDHIKGPLKGEWSESVEQGIKLHRSIDAYIDHHPQRQLTLTQMPARLRRFGGILLDIHDDYLLTQHWPRFHKESIATLQTAVDQVLQQSVGTLPHSAARHAQAVVTHQVLLAFSRWTAVTGSIERVALRLDKPDLASEGSAWLKGEYDALEQRFLNYYPDLLILAAERKAAFNAAR